MVCALTKDEKHIAIYRVIKRLCLIGGVMLFIRYLIADIPGYTNFDFSRG
jgi:hypothetical protein